MINSLFKFYIDNKKAFSAVRYGHYGHTLYYTIRPAQREDDGSFHLLSREFDGSTVRAISTAVAAVVQKQIVLLPFSPNHSYKLSFFIFSYQPKIYA